MEIHCPTQFNGVGIGSDYPMILRADSERFVRHLRLQKTAFLQKVLILKKVLALRKPKHYL
jgi:hypothetical protein